MYIQFHARNGQTPYKSSTLLQRLSNTTVSIEEQSNLNAKQQRRVEMCSRCPPVLTKMARTLLVVGQHYKITKQCANKIRISVVIVQNVPPMMRPPRHYSLVNSVPLGQYSLVNSVSLTNTLSPLGQYSPTVNSVP